MKKNFLLVCAITLLCNTQAFAIENVNQNPHILSIKGSASEQIQPDTAIITLGVETTAKKVVDATSANANAATKVINSLKSLISTGDTLKTQSFRVSPRYEYDKTTSKNVLVGYTVSNEVVIKTKLISSVGNLIDTAISNGANNVQGINFILDKDESAKNRLLVNAVKNAKQTAAILSTELNKKIIGVERVSTYFNESSNQPIMYAKTMAFDRAGATSTPIESGDLKIDASVDIDFILE